MSGVRVGHWCRCAQGSLLRDLSSPVDSDVSGGAGRGGGLVRGRGTRGRVGPGVASGPRATVDASLGRGGGCSRNRVSFSSSSGASCRCCTPCRASSDAPPLPVSPAHEGPRCVALLRHPSPSRGARVPTSVSWSGSRSSLSQANAGVSGGGWGAERVTRPRSAGGRGPCRVTPAGVPGTAEVGSGPSDAPVPSPLIPTPVPVLVPVLIDFQSWGQTPVTWEPRSQVLPCPSSRQC